VNNVPAILCVVAILLVIADMAQHRAITLSLVGVLLVAIAVLLVVQ
jgi:hypothetical protein